MLSLNAFPSTVEYLTEAVFNEENRNSSETFEKGVQVLSTKRIHLEKFRIWIEANSFGER